MISQKKKYIKWNDQKKFRVAKEGAFMISCLIKSKASCSICPRLKIKFFLIMDWRGKTICEKSGTNILTKLICPRKDCIDFLLWGKGIWEISLILSGSMWIPYLDTMNPMSFPSLNAKKDFLGLREISYLWQCSNICFKSLRWLLRFLEYTVMSSK